MTSSRYLVLAAAASFSVVACNGGNSNQKPTAENQQPQSGPAWALNLKSACADAAQDQCLAKYGFTVDAAGAFQVGPGPQGQVRVGMLSDTEFAALKTQVQAALSSSSSTRAESHDTDVENVSDDTLTLTKPGAAPVVLAHNTAGDFYFTTSTSDEAQSLHAAIRDLANSYYRMPFGDACGDGADKFEAAAVALASCQVDTDCVYVDAYQGFEIVPPSTVQWLLTEDCTAIQPPVVANKLAIEGGAQSLIDLYASVRTSCGSEFSQSALGHDCSYAQKATSAQPVCRANRCVSQL